MRHKCKDLTGQIFSQLTVLSFAGQDAYKNNLWLCKCDCGNVCTATFTQLCRGKKKSCGCRHGKEAKIFLLEDSVGICLLGNGDYFWFDAQDLPLVQQYHWTTHSQGYAHTFCGGQRLRFSRLVMGLQIGDKRQIDHINGDVRDNRRCNLRICTIKENVRHKKGVLGYAQSRCGHYVASIEVDGVRINLGTYATKEEASAAYKAASILHHKEFAAHEGWDYYYGCDNG